MKKIIISLLTLCVSAIAIAQDITGQWSGMLKVQGMQLRIVFNINKTANGFSSTMDSPDQNVKGILVTTTTFDSGKLQLAITNAGITYNGEYKDSLITGTFKQSGLQIPLNLSRKILEAVAKPKRPQEPVKPYPYYSEDITFQNTPANIVLAGTLTLPAKEGNYPVVILITGSGPQNRDEELAGHKPFLVIADYLTKNGIAVLRYDDRGTAQSTGDFSTATSADFATDVNAAIAYLKTRKEINTKKIGLMGHSEGGMIAPMVAANNKDVHFIVLLAGPGIPIKQLMLMQETLIAKSSGVSEADITKMQKQNTETFNMMQQSASIEKLKTAITEHLKMLLKDSAGSPSLHGMSVDDYVKQQVSALVTPWMQYFIKYDPAPVLEKVRCPVLAVNGEKDLQVPPKEDLAAIENALKKGGNKNVTIKEFPGLNHLFQECTTGSPSEYATIEQTFSPAALTEITNWIKNQVK